MGAQPADIFSRYLLQTCGSPTLVMCPDHSIKDEMEELDIGAFPVVNTGFREIEAHVKRKYK